MSVRAKFKVTKITQQDWSPNHRSIELSAVYDTSIEEDKRFAEATPSGTITMYVTNPAAIEKLPLGKSFYVDFTPVE